MPWNDVYANFDLATGSNDGTSEANAWQSFTDISGGIAPGDRLNLKKLASPYPVSGTDGLTVSGTALLPIWIRPYETTIGDGGFFEVEFVDVVTTLNLTGSYTYVDNLKVTTDGTTSLDQFTMSAVGSVLRNSYVLVHGGIQLLNTYGCYLESTRDQPIVITGTNQDNAKHFKTYFKNLIGTSYLVESNQFARNSHFNRCIFHGSGSNHGFRVGSALTSAYGVSLDTCCFYDVVDGLYLEGLGNGLKEWLRVTNCLFDTIGGYCVKDTTASDTGYVHLVKNHYYSATSGFTDLSFLSDWENVALTASALTDPANGDFTINDAPNGGVVLKETGFPVQMPYDWDAGGERAVYQGPTPSEIADAVWNRGGRSLTA